MDPYPELRNIEPPPPSPPGLVMAGPPAATAATRVISGTTDTDELQLGEYYMGAVLETSKLGVRRTTTYATEWPVLSGRGSAAKVVAQISAPAQVADVLPRG